MANPALKNGYFSIANELAEQFAMRNIPGNEMRILWVVLRNTWGWEDGERRKDWDKTAFSQFSKATGMKNGNVARSIKSVVAKRLLNYETSKGYQLNQDYDKWLVAKRLSVANELPSGSQKAIKKVAKRIVSKEIKETIKERGADSPPTPKDNTKFFFKGITDFLQKIPSGEAEAMKELLRKISLEQGIESLSRKKLFWDEIVKFGDYWQEKDHLGKREKWEMEKTFEVEKRLQTWLRRAGQWSKPAGQTNNKGRGFA